MLLVRSRSLPRTSAGQPDEALSVSSKSGLARWDRGREKTEKFADRWKDGRMDGRVGECVSIDSPNEYLLVLILVWTA